MIAKTVATSSVKGFLGELGEKNKEAIAVCLR